MWVILGLYWFVFISSTSTWWWVQVHQYKLESCVYQVGETTTGWWLVVAITFIVITVKYSHDQVSDKGGNCHLTSLLIQCGYIFLVDQTYNDDIKRVCRKWSADAVLKDWINTRNFTDNDYTGWLIDKCQMQQKLCNESSQLWLLNTPQGSELLHRRLGVYHHQWCIIIIIIIVIIIIIIIEI